MDSSDQSSRPALSATSRRMQELRQEIFNGWEKRVRAEVKQAEGLRHPILIDTLPAFYDNLVESVTPGYPRNSAVEGSTLASEHGGERARITAYNHRALIQEYQLLRWAILDVLQRHGVALSAAELHAINASIDAGIQEAVEAFSLVASGLRERFAAALTHDMRGPLGATVTALELVLLLNDISRIKAVVAKALTNAHRMSGMLDELLNAMAFHSGESLQLNLSNFDIYEVVKEIQSDATAVSGPRFRVQCMPVVGWWDRSAVKRAIENLLTNAVKYGAPDKPINVTVQAEHGRMTIVVQNEGDPIPPEERENIFQMYRRTEAAKNSAKAGWGIGLPYVRAVAESHGGSVGLDSSAEGGTAFTIDIPIDCRPLLGAPTLAEDTPPAK